MNSFIEFGQRIRIYRVRKDENITQAAKNLDVDRTYLSRLENGHLQPTRKVLEKICKYYSISQNDASEIYTLAGYAGKDIVMQNKEREGVEKIMEENQISKSKDVKGVELNVPNNAVVIYTDSAFVTTNEFGCVIDFAQRLGSTNKQNVVARVGMSKDHAKALIKVLQERLDEKGFIAVTKRVES